MPTTTEVLQRRYNRRRVRWISGLYLLWMTFEVTVQIVMTSRETGSVFPTTESLLSSLVPFGVVACAFASLLLAFTRHQRAAEVLQITFLLLGGSAAIAMNPTSTPASGTFYVLALFLASRYGFLERHAIAKAVILGLLFLASVVVSALLYLSLVVYALLGAVVFVIIYTALWFFAAEVEIRGLTRRFTALSSALTGNKRTIDLGRGALGIVHALSGRLVALERAVEMLQSGQHAAGMSRLVAVQQDVTSLLENLKQSVIHQSETEPHVHQVGDVLRGLVDLAQLSGNNGGPDRSLSLEIVEDIELHAPPAEIHTLFDTVLQNALEAGARKVAITVGPGRSATVSNDGPPIPFCVGCKRLDCMGCREFREGRSTKPGGSGIGMVVAREIMSSHGTLSLSSTPERTEVRFAFR